MKRLHLVEELRRSEVLVDDGLQRSRSRWNRRGRGPKPIQLTGEECQACGVRIAIQVNRVEIREFVLNRFSLRQEILQRSGTNFTLRRSWELLAGLIDEVRVEGQATCIRIAIKQITVHRGIMNPVLVPPAVAKYSSEPIISAWIS